MRRGPPEDIFDEPGVDAEGRPVVVRELAAGRAFVEPFLDGASGGGAAGSTAGSAVPLEGPKLRDALPALLLPEATGVQAERVLQAAVGLRAPLHRLGPLLSTPEQIQSGSEAYRGLHSSPGAVQG